MGFLYGVHSVLRWLIVVVAVIAAIYFGMAWLRRTAGSRADHGLLAAYTGLLDLQALVGLLIIVFLGGLTLVRVEHFATMLVAIVVAHLPARLRAAAENLRARNSFLAVVASLLVILAGVTIVNGWVR